jgi:phage terminase large subunit-like protein
MAETRLEYQKKLAKAKLLEEKIKLQRGLPHLYGFKHYRWSREFFESQSKDCFLLSGNQTGKSSAQIRKVIHWATAKELWPKLWNHQPLQFWQLYPNKDVATVEFKKKWEPLFMPRGEFKDHPIYGWQAEYQSSKVHAIHFNSGVSIYFKAYSQNVMDLQSSSVDYISCDEELPADLWSELNMRRAATDGYFSMAFTATMGQEFWREVMEESGDGERFPDAHKIRATMYDCLKYEDGSPGAWTVERIERLKQSCKNETEIQKRIYGRFVVDDGLKYPGFERGKNFTPGGKPPATSWPVYCGVDPGSGGSGHPAAISFIAVRPDYRRGRVFRFWRGDGELTTAGDVFSKFLEMKKELVSLGYKIEMQLYDHAGKDFHTIASRAGESFTPAERSHEIGEQVLNVLFKTGALTIDSEPPEHKKLMLEFVSLKRDTPKRKALDDGADSTRYPCASIPWDWESLSGIPPALVKKKRADGMSEEERMRREAFQNLDDDPDLSIENELEAFNELYED